MSRAPARLVLVATLALVASGCPHPAPKPTDDLSRALGAATPERHVAEHRDEPGEWLTFDLEPFFEAGLSNPQEAVTSLVQKLAAPAKFEAPYRLEVAGRHLVVRHERPVLERVRALLEYLERTSLAPIVLDVHLVEVPLDMAAPLEGPRGIDARLPDELRAKLVAPGAEAAVKTLARRQLRLTDGQWARAADNRSRRPIVRVVADDRLPVEVQDTAQDGLALNAAVWLSTAGDAVVHVEAALQTEAPQDPLDEVRARFHPVPETRSVEVEAVLDLPALRSTAIRGQLRVERGAWHIAGSAPAPEGKAVVLALVRADWTPPARLALPQNAKGRQAAALPIALPESRLDATQTKARGTVWELKAGAAPQAGGGVWLGQELGRQSTVNVQYENDIERGATAAPAASREESGQRAVAKRIMGLSSASPAPWQPLLPPELEARTLRVLDATWDDTTALAFRWDNLYLVQEPKVLKDVEDLFRDVQAWRNRPIRVRAEWVEIEPALVDALARPEGALRHMEELRRARLLPPFEVVARSGAWTEMAVSKSHTVLWGFFGPDRGSPETRVLDEGGKLSVLPRRYGSGRVELDVRFSSSAIERGSLTSVTVAGGVLERPRFTQSDVEDVVAVESGKPIVIVESSAGSTGGKVRALVVTAWD